MKAGARLPSPPLLGGLLAAASGALLAAAFYFQYVEGLAPCPLCIAQRWAHGASLSAGLAALLAGGRRAGPWLLAATAVAFLAGAAIAFYHVAVEQHWVESAFCDGAAIAADSIQELEALLMATEPARCDLVPWSLAGLSMAGWNVVLSLGLGLAALAGAREAGKGR